MSSSTDGPAPSVATEVPVPGALSSMWRLFRLGYTHEPGLLVFAVAVTVVSAVPDALIALLLKVLADAVQDGSGARAAYAMGGLAVAVTFNWLLTVVQSRMTRRFRDKVTIALEGHVARLQASIETIAHHERADYLDRLAVLRNQIFVLDHMYVSVLSTLSWLVRLTITLALLASISPMLLSSSWPPTQERAVEEAAAVHQRLADHLFQTATTASAGKEVRVTGIGPWLVGARRAEWELWYGPVHRARAATALWHALAWTVFGAGFVGAVWFVAVHLHRSSGDVLLILMAGSRLSAYVASTVSEIGFLRGVWLYGAQRLAWLEDYAEALRAAGDLEAPSSLAQGIELRDVTFTYPGSDRPALDHVTLTLPAGAVVAIVGENGAGKSTLVKLLAKFYEPESGEILLDGRPLRRIRTESWRARMSGAFQDFHRFEFAARTSVGLGDLPQLGGREGWRVRRGPPAPTGPGHPARTGLARRSRCQLRPVAEARPRPRLHAGQPFAPRPRRADRGPGRRDRARPLRAVCRVGGRPRARRDHGARLAPVLDGADGRPHRRPRRVWGG